MPWEPGAQRRNPYLWARVLASYGLNQRQILKRLRETYNVPGAPDTLQRQSDLTRAAQLGREWQRRIDRLRRSEGDAGVPERSWSLVNKNIDKAYRYHVIFHLPPGEDGEETHRTVIINSSRRLSFAEMGDMAVTAFQELQGLSPRLRKVYIDGATPFDLQAMERRSN